MKLEVDTYGENLTVLKEATDDEGRRRSIFNRQI
jgi:hypothetical protein